MIDDTTGTGIPTVETHDGLRWGCKIVQRGDGLFDVVSACGVFYLGGGLWYTLPSDPIDVGVFDDEHDAAKWLSDTKYAPPSWYAAELARVQAQRDALAEAPADTDAPGAKDGPITAAEDPYKLLGGFVKNRSLITADEHFAGPFEKLMDRAAACIAGRITPEADEQTDGKGRTLKAIDADLELFLTWRETTNATLQYLLKRETAISHDTQSLMKWSRQDRDRLDELETSLDRLIAARVSKPCEPSKATGQNELASAVQAADWREALVPVRLDDDTMVWWMTPDCKYYSANYTDPTCGWGNVQNTLDALKTASTVPHVAYQTRDALPEPPNLREWWPAKADDFKPTPEQQRFLASVCESCRSVVRAMLAKGDIPGVVKTNQS